MVIDALFGFLLETIYLSVWYILLDLSLSYLFVFLDTLLSEAKLAARELESTGVKTMEKVSSGVLVCLKSIGKSRVKFDNFSI